jgi:HTH-type transcriptional regulator / antitoxin HipB
LGRAGNDLQGLVLPNRSKRPNYPQMLPNRSKCLQLCYTGQVTETRLFELEDLGAWIKEARKRRGWTQAELAANAGAGRSQVQKAEAGRGDIQLKVALKVIAALSADLAVVSKAAPKEVYEGLHGV